MTEAELHKHLGDKTFQFEFAIQNDKLKIGLKEVNAGNPLCYEIYLSLEEFYKKNAIYKACTNLEEIRQHLLHAFKNDSTSLENLEDGKKIQINFEIINISKIIKQNFILDRKDI